MRVQCNCVYENNILSNCKKKSKNISLCDNTNWFDCIYQQFPRRQGIFRRAPQHAMPSPLKTCWIWPAAFIKHFAHRNFSCETNFYTHTLRYYSSELFCKMRRKYFKNVYIDKIFIGDDFYFFFFGSVKLFPDLNLCDLYL